jgi:uncharacterized YccA/Bax inhibitor family protein
MSMQTTDRPRGRGAAYRRLNDAFPLQPGGKEFTAAGVYDKVGLLTVLALITGVYGYLSGYSALILPAILVGFGLAMLGRFMPTTAKFAAPAYALVEGYALGAITSYYAVGSNSIVPLAIIYTGGIFLGALIVFRSGLVKVTHRFVSMAMMAAVGFLCVLLASAFGLPIPGLSGSGGDLLIGVFGVIVGTMFLFIDFNFAQVSEQRRASAEGEWLGALLIMNALVLVYINVLGIMGRRR